VVLADRHDLERAGRDGSGEHGVGVADGEDHADGRAVAEGVRIALRVLLDPEVGAADRQLRDHHAARVLEPLQFDRAESGPVEPDRRAGVGDREPRGDAGGGRSRAFAGHAHLRCVDPAVSIARGHPRRLTSTSVDVRDWVIAIIDRELGERHASNPGDAVRWA
jgi:hypothetical protein